MTMLASVRLNSDPSSLRSVKSRRYYDCDIETYGAPEVDIRIDQRLYAPFPVSVLRSRSRWVCRRSWNHIRSNHIDLSILWFVKRGRLSVTHSSGSVVVESGECFITQSSQPYCIESILDADSLNEALYVMVPTDILQGYVPPGIGIGVPLSATSGDCQVAEQILSIVFEQGERLGADFAESLIRACLCAAGAGVRNAGEKTPRYQTIAEKRLADVELYINLNLSNPDLTASAAAKACGISARYLCYLLRSRGTAFSNLLWSKRLNRAKELLLLPDMKHCPVGEIAYKVGFKSAAHFSRMFKKEFAATPRQFRTENAGLEAARGSHALYAVSEALTH
jgi:AraC family transcriptional regulator, positive regulator of tynA and feaB